ncbi:hypothetical protein CYANOKiyG1_78520 [Okeania sp. KiyG1]|nr:hypothetical protein CYANOKiyG1_78520 [Okeania sp. KiyG1]
MVQNRFLDENAAINILVAGGQSETLNGRGGKHNPPHPLPGGSKRVGAAACVSGSYAKQNVNPARGFGWVKSPRF